jgi:hypothetical protein
MATEPEYEDIHLDIPGPEFDPGDPEALARGCTCDPVGEGNSWRPFPVPKEWRMR